MANPTAPSYGEPNWDLVGRWLHLPPEEDGPFWALNLMRYREKAVYADGSDRGLSGQEADDAYAPLGPLGAVGAMVAFHGEVTDQTLGEPAWDRIGIVRYPTRPPSSPCSSGTTSRPSTSTRRRGWRSRS